MPDRLEVISAHHERAVVAVGDAVLKIETDPDRMTVEEDALRLAGAAGIPVPHVLWSRPPVLAMSKLAGEPLALAGEEPTTSASAWIAAGALLRRLHALALPPWPGRKVDDTATYVDECVGWLLERGVVERDHLDHAVRAAQSALRPFPLVFAHGDFQPAHVFVDGDEVVGVIDWSDACQGDALYDLAILTAGFEERLDDVLEGYGAPDADRDVIRAWWAIRRIGSVRWMIEHGFDATGDIAVLRPVPQVDSDPADLRPKGEGG